MRSAPRGCPLASWLPPGQLRLLPVPKTLQPPAPSERRLLATPGSAGCHPTTDGSRARAHVGDGRVAPEDRGFTSLIHVVRHALQPPARRAAWSSSSLSRSCPRSFPLLTDSHSLLLCICESAFLLHSPVVFFRFQIKVTSYSICLSQSYTSLNTVPSKPIHVCKWHYFILLYG